MKKQVLIMIMAVIYSVFPYVLTAQNNGFTHELTPDDVINPGIIKSMPAVSGPPVPPVRSIAEFEPMEGVLIAYPGDFGIPYSLIAELSKDVMVMTIVGNASDESIVRSNYSSNNVVLSNCSFVQAPVDTYWTRDYGPFYIEDNLNRISIVDIFYSYLRPNDNAIPAKMSEVLGVDCYYMDMAIQGGNYMSDGMGVAASTRLLLDDNPDLDETSIKRLAADYLNISTYHIVEDPNSTYIDHIDCWGKFLSVDTILIRKVPPSDPQYQKIENTATYFLHATSSYGTPYTIVRIDTPNDEPYTNSLIINNKVFVPCTGSPNDDAAVRTYAGAMPGYRVFGITANRNSWLSGDALHCRTKGIPDRNMIDIRHMPLLGTQDEASAYPIEADIVSCAGEVIYADDVKIFYKKDDGSFTSTTMQYAGGNTYRGTIPRTTEREVSYYISAADASGRTYRLPYIGEGDPFRFIVEGPAPTPDIGTIRGDVDSNGAVNIVDALLTAQYYVGLDPAGFDKSKADTDCDNGVDIVDALLIAQLYVGLITGFCR
ncbi:MAG: agmatine deiminase family protein [Spirochaetales bacterium]|nr:agmatine deiminase family protein [Spirochaetales bacterium]